MPDGSDGGRAAPPTLAWCRLAGCTARYAWPHPGSPPRHCPEHRGRRWTELWIARARAGFTVREVAERSGIPATYVHHLEQGQRQPSPAHVRRIAAALDVAADRLTPHADTVIPAELLADVTEAAG